MTGIRSFVCLTAFAGCFFAQAVVAQQPDQIGTPISADNAKHVKPVRVVEKRADRLARGPKPGQWVITTRDSQASNQRARNRAELVDGNDFRAIRPLAPEFSPGTVVFSPDGNRIAFKQPGSSKYIVSDVDGGNAITIEIGNSPSGVAFAPDGQFLAIGCVFWDPQIEGAGFSEIRLFDAEGKHVRTFESNGAGAIRPVFSPDGETLAAGNRNDETQLFDVATGRLLHKLHKRMTQEHAFSPDGKLLVEGYVDGTVAVWEVASGRLLRAAESGCREIYSVDWSPTGDVFATSGLDGNIILWDPRNLSKLQELDAPFWVIRVRFSDDGTQLLTSSASNHHATDDRRITVWEAVTR